MKKVAREIRQQTLVNNLSEDQDKEAGKLVPGFSVQRRQLLWLPVLTASALLMGRPRELFARQPANEESLKRTETNKDAGNALVGELTWDDFIKQSVPEAQELYKNPSPRGQDAYLFSIAHWAARLRLESIPRAKIFRFGELSPPVHFGVGYRGTPFFVVEWWLEPGAFLPPHNHPNANVCTLGLAGEAHIRNFQIVGQAPAYSSQNTFRVRETHSEMISEGRINSLSSTRDNIHTFQAGKAGARGIDISTVYGKQADFSFLNIDKNPIDADERIYEATWKKLS